MAYTITQVDAHITHVDKEGPLIKIFAQTDKNSAYFVERILYQLKNVFDTKTELKPKTLKDISPGLTCCAKFEDDKYYRAKIDNLDALRDYKVKVVFIDHGNTELVNVHDIRLVNKLALMTNDQSVKNISELQGIAEEFYLAEIAPVAKEWDYTTLELLRKKLCNNDLKCAVYDSVQGKRLIKILKAECNPATMLSSINVGYPVTLVQQERFIKKIIEKEALVEIPVMPEQFNVPPPNLVMQQPPPARLPNIAQPPPLRISQSNTIPGTHSSQSMPIRLSSGPVRSNVPGILMRKPEVQTVQSFQFSTEMLAAGVTHPVYVSHVEDGPQSFAVQIQSIVQDVLVQLMVDLNNHTPQPIKGPLNPGSICLGRYSADNSLCRAIVMNVLDDKVKLYFADFGSSEILPYSEIYEIPPQFVSQKVMSHRFTLANIKDVIYTEEQKQLFKDLVANSRCLMMKVTEPEANPLKQYCELYLNCKNIKQIMQEVSQTQAFLRYAPLSMPIKGSQEKVFVSFVLNPGRFFVQLDKNSFSLNQIMSCVANHCLTASHIPLVNIRPGEPCCALYEDNKWYRAEILKQSADRVFINFVDYGNQEEIELINLRQITPELVKSVKAQAIACCLKGYELRYNVDEDVANRLEELILEKNLMMHVTGCTSGVLVVEFIDSKGQDINSQLEAKPSRSPVYNNYEATAAPSVITTLPTQSNQIDGWEDSQQAVTQSRVDKKFDSRGPSEDGKNQWRSREDNDIPPRFNKESVRWNESSKPDRRFNKDSEDKPWNKGDGRYDRDENKKFGGERGSNFNVESGRFARDSDSRGGKFGDDRSNKFNKEDGEGRFNKFDDEKQWRKRDDNSGGWKQNKESEDNGGWNRNKGNSAGGWKDRESSSGWKDGGGDRRNNDTGFKRGGSFNRDSGGDRSTFRKPWEKGSGDSFGKSAPKSPKPDTVGGIPHSTIKVGMTEEVQVVFTTSPVEFYVQLNNSFDQLNQMMEKIASVCESGGAEDMNFVQEKSACLAKYSEDDTWYRAYIEEKSFDMVKVLFVDYGNQENVPLDKIKTLPEDMTILPVQAVKCRLFGVPESAEVGVFSALVDGKTLKTQFVAKHFLTKSFQVVMIDEENGSNINTVMGAADEEIQSAVSKLGLVNLSSAQFPAGSTLVTQMTWYISPSQFYLQPMDSNSEFRAMMQNMQSVVRGGTVKQNNQLNIGDFVIAKFKLDKVLYRALVKEIGFVPTVQYVDYGNIEAVDSGSVWAMEAEYATLPMQALSCCLAAVQPKGDAWPKADTTELDKMFEAETLDCSIVKVLDGEPQYLVKLVKENEDVAQKVINAGFGVPGSDAIGVPVELDTSLLVGQLLPVVLLRVENNYTFYIQPTTEDSIELQSLETAAGEGIKCSLSNVRDDSTEDEQFQFSEILPNTNVIILVDTVQTDELQVTLYDSEGRLLPLQGGEVSTVGKICPLPVLNTHQRVCISYASDGGIFLHKTQFGDILPELLQKLYDFYNESEQVEQEWDVGEICCAKSVSDLQWYRAQILAKETEVTEVFYIDYGNCESIPVCNLRKLDPSFYIPHALALKSSLHISWTVPVENLMELSDGIEYNAVVLRNGNKWIVELVDNSGHSLTEKLVELGFAVALENSPFKRVVEGGRFVEGSDIAVSVSFVDSPVQLWIFVGNDIELIEALQDRLQEAAPKLPSLKEPIGIFAAKFSDGLWYRAIKLNDTTVRFIDYGNSDEVDMSDIKALTADFLEPAEGYAVKVELPIMEFKEGAKEKVEELIVSPEIDSEEDIVAHILSVKDSAIVADILKGGKSVVDILVEANLATRFLNLFSAFVSHVNSLDDFFIQQVGSEEMLESMASSLTTAESFEPISNINECDILAAFYVEDGLWYRAKVMRKTDSIEVLFIDYGNSALATDFRELPHDLATKPPLSKHCSLCLPNGIGQWSESANNKFIEICADGFTQFDVKFLDQKDPAKVTLNFNGKCVSEELELLCDGIQKGMQSPLVDLSIYEQIVYISHCNSPNDFYVQLEGAEKDLDAITNELSSANAFEALEQNNEELSEKLIGALFIDDDLWYRAKVLNISEAGSEVLFVDYGNSAIATKFVKLPETLEKKIPVAIHCALGKEDWCEEASAYFSELTGGGSVHFKFKILEEGHPNMVSLVKEDIFIEKELLRLFMQPKSVGHSKSNIAAGSPQNEIESSNGDDNNIIKSVYLIHVNSPSDFFLHTAEATQLVEEISERLTAAENFQLTDESNKSKGKIVASQFDEDDLWYRAKILEHSENETKVLFIDYGNTAKVAKMKDLPDNLLSTPPLAMHCALQLLGGTEWSLSACETFHKLANDDGVSFDLKIVSEGEPNIVVLYINGESVAEQIVIASGLITEDNVSLGSKKVESTDEAKQYSDASPANSSLDGEGKHSKILNDNIEENPQDSITGSIKVGTSNHNHNLQNSNDCSESNIKAVEISHFNNSCDFFVQFSIDKEELMKITNEMSEGDTFESMLDAEEMLAAKYTCDGLWYRAKILDTTSSGTTVLFVDYGNTDTTNEFRMLPKHLREKKPVAKHCQLKSTQNTPWSASTDEKLSALAKIDGFIFDIIILEEGDPCTVDLFVAGRSLMETFTTQEITEKHVNIGELIMQSVENKISDNINREVQSITDELLLSAVNSSNEKTPFTERSNELLNDSNVNQDICTQSQDYELDSQNKKECSSYTSTLENIANTSNSSITNISTESTLNHENEGPGTVIIDAKTFSSTPQKIDIDEYIVPGCIASDKQHEEEGLETDSNQDNTNISTKNNSNQILEDPDALKREGSLSIEGKKSSTTPRRINIDDHIVPGCISTVKLEEFSEQS